MIIHFAFIAFALALLFIGAEGLVRGSSSLALRAGLSRLMVGLTIVAFGTSSPELVVSVKATLSQQGDIAVGNVVGSNIFNIAVILGITALLCPIPVHRQIIRIDAPIALALTGLLIVLLLNDSLGRLEGLLLFTGIVAYTVMNVLVARREAGAGGNGGNDTSAPDVSRHWSIDTLFILGGLGILILGSRLLVDHSVLLARGFGISEAVIGLTIVAAGTSMPERVHGAFVSDEEVHRVCDDWRKRGEPDYLEEILEGGSDLSAPLPGMESADGGEEDYPLYDEAGPMSPSPAAPPSLRCNVNSRSATTGRPAWWKPWKWPVWCPKPGTMASAK